MDSGTRLPPNAVPLRAAAAGGTVRVDLVDLGGRRFEEPFFDRAVERFARDAPLRAFRLPLDHLERLVAAERVAPPALLVFHTGRCGSTLLGNLLDEHPRLRVIQEPEVVNRALAEDLATDAGLRALVTAFGRGLPAEDRSVLKLTSWATGSGARLLRALPRTPAVFLWREPAEVVASCLADPPGWGPAPRGSADRGPRSPARPAGSGTADAAFYAAAWRAAAEGGLALHREFPDRVRVVSYRALAAAAEPVAADLARSIGIPFPAAVLDAVRRRADRYSKAPVDAAGPAVQPATRRSLPSADSAAVARIAGDLPGRLERLSEEFLYSQPSSTVPPDAVNDICHAPTGSASVRHGR